LVGTRRSKEQLFFSSHEWLSWR